MDDWSQGIPLSYVQALASHWVRGYDWKRAEATLNGYEQFVTEIDGLDIHFLHIRSRHAKARPLILTHGWPGSVVEFLNVIGPLTDPVRYGGAEEEAFHLVCPSLPGFGFSGKPATTGWGVAKIATAWDTLMTRLGYDRYFAQGGDWGGAITAAIGAQNLGHCAGIHVNLAFVQPDPGTLNDLQDDEKAALAAFQHYQDWDSGYSKQQSTRPQTIGYGLADSPVGQMAWIIEKFWAWTDCDGHPENVISRDTLLDNVMLYWLPNTAASSARLYWESFRTPQLDGIEIPSAISQFPKEIFQTSERWARQRFRDLVYFNRLEKGGHFAAMEQPDLFVGEVRKAFGKMAL